MAKKKPAKTAPPPRGNEAAEIPLNQQVCQRVKVMRRRKGWTLEQLASLSGVSRSMLSQIERGTCSPTLGVAYRIAQAFQLTLGELVDTATPSSRIDVIRSDDEAYLFRDDAHCRIRTLSPLQLEKEVEFYQLVLKPAGMLSSAAHFQGTREFLTVEKGRVRVTSADIHCELSKGDSAHYAADVPHEIQNIGRGEAILFLVDIYGRGVTGHH